MAYDMIVYGSISYDVILSGVERFPKPGEEVWAKALDFTLGGSFNTAAAAARLNIKAGVVGVLGTDFISAQIRAACYKEMVDTCLLLEVRQPHEPLSFVFNFGSDRSFISYSPPGNVLSRHMDQVVDTHPAAISVFSISSDDHALERMRRAKAAGSLLLLDCCSDEALLRRPIAKQQVAVSDFFVPDQYEAELITGEADPARAAEQLAQLGTTAVVTLGAEGALWAQNGALHRRPAFCYGPVVDTTGAGDNFTAGFSYGLLHKKPLETCVRYGLMCGSKSVVAVGGFTAALYESELQYLERHNPAPARAVPAEKAVTG